nr:hypothetical protein Iba_chr02eCG1560 [Ipomoea batatas]
MDNISGTDGSFKPTTHSAVDLKPACPVNGKLSFRCLTAAPVIPFSNMISFSLSPQELVLSDSETLTKFSRTPGVMLMPSLSFASNVKLSTINRMPSADSMASTRKARRAVSSSNPKAPSLSSAFLFSLILQHSMSRLRTATSCSWYLDHPQKDFKSTTFPDCTSYGKLYLWILGFLSVFIQFFNHGFSGFTI